MNPSILTVYEPPFRKRRFGRDGDGGYVACVIPEGYDILVSAGIDKDLSFEEEWLRENPGVSCVAFDGTITSSPSDDPRIEWVRKNVGARNSESLDDLGSVMRGHDRIFLKMDIEGSETDWLLHTENLGRVSQMVVEFHYSPFGPKSENAFIKLNETHVLVHMHGNNFSGTVTHEGVVFPVSFECTYIHRRFFREMVPNKSPLPGPHDRPNNVGGKDIDLNHPPFVTKSHSPTPPGGA